MDGHKSILSPLGSIVRNLILFLYALFILAPLVCVVLLSLKPDGQMFTSMFAFSPTMGNFAAVLGDQGFLRSLWNNLLISSLAVALALVVGVPAAYALARCEFKGGKSITWALVLLRFAPEILVVIALYFVYERLGLIDGVPGLVLVYQLISLPPLIWILRGVFEDIPAVTETAALVDGYSRWQVFFKIVLPTARPGILAAALLCFIFCWNSFTFALLLGGASTQTSTVMATSLLASGTVHYGWVAAAAVLSALPAAVLAFLLRRELVRGLSFGTVKG